jgi:phosphatidate phosphatase APP1
MVLPLPRPVRVQPFFGYRSRDRLVLGARAVRSRAPAFEWGSRLRAVRTVLAQFAPREKAGLAIRLEIRNDERVLIAHELVTDDEGYVLFDLPLAPRWDLPEHPEWEVATLSWDNRDGPQRVDAQLLVPGTDSDLAVISDIDDTIIETGITGGLGSVLRNWRRIFAQLPHERIAVAGADLFYGELGGGTTHHPPDAKRPARSILATRRPFFYVSSSPWNLFSYLVAFQRSKGLPLGPLLLRQWGLDKRTLGKASHGAHKRLAIDAILGMYPALRFALIGDDTQGDLPAFAEVVAAYPGRIAAVFLRTVSDQSFTAEEEAALVALKASGVPLWLGDSYAVGAAFLHTLGFTPGGETEQIVRAVEGAGRDTAADPVRENAPHGPPAA